MTFSSSDLSVGTHTISLTVTDDKNATASDDVVITVNDVPPPPVNPKPIANAGEDQTVTEGSAVTLDASGSTGDIKSYVWKEDGTVLSEESNFTKDNFNVGVHTLLLEVTESDGDTDSDSVTISVTAIEKTSKNVADGYIIKLASPAVAVCNNGHEYNSSMSVGEKGKIIFPAVQLTSDCNISVASGAIIDSNNNGIYDADTDTPILFEMRASADATYISPLTTLLLLKEEKGEDISQLKPLIKDFDPVTAVTTIKNSTGAEVEQAKKMLTLMEVLKTSMENNASSTVLNDINLSTLTENNSTDFNVTLFTQNLPLSFKDKAYSKTMLMKNLIDLLPSIDSNIIDLESFNVALSDGGKSIEDAFKASVRASVSSSVRSAIENAVDFNATLRNVIKNSYGSEQRNNIFNYFSIVHNNLNAFHQGHFNFNTLDINSSLLITRTLEIENIADLDGVYKVTSLDMRNDNDYYDDVNNKNYNTRYQKNENSNVDNSFYIQTNAVSKFEIVEGLDSSFFRISQGNRKIAYMDLRDGLSSPTIDNYEDANHDGVYEVEVKITDVQLLQSRTIVVKFAIVDEQDKDIFANPISTKTGYITKDAVVGGLVLDRSNNYEWYEKIDDLISIDNIDIASMRLEGEGSDDFEIIDNQKIKVANLLDYDTKSIYNFTVVATDNNAKEYNATLTINVTNDSNRTMQFNEKESLEKLSFRSTLGTNYNSVDYFHLNHENPATFKVEEGLDSKFFHTHINYDNYSNISYDNWLETNSSFNPSYLNPEDENGDGIYEVNLTATDVQTLETTSMVLKYKLVSSYFDLNNYYNNIRQGRERESNFDINQETVVGGEVPSTFIRIDIADDVNITDMHLEGEGNADFNITDNAIMVVNSLDASTKNNYSLKVVSTDTTGYVNEQNITINVNQGQTHNEFNITNRDEIDVNLFSVNWYDWYSNNDIQTNNTARMRFKGDDADTVVDMEHFNRYYNGHSTYFWWEKNYSNYEDSPTYLNPKDENGDNIYEFQVELTDIQTLEKQTVDYRFEMLSHQVQPYWAYLQNNYPNYQPYRHRNNVEVNLSIPTEAPIGGELLEKDGAKGFYLEMGRDITFDTASLEGVGAEKFEVVANNAIVLKEHVNQGDEYNLTLVITDSEAQESRNPLYIRVGSVNSVTPIFKASKTQKMLKATRTLKTTKTTDRREREQERFIYEMKRREEQERIRREKEEEL